MVRWRVNVQMHTGGEVRFDLEELSELHDRVEGLGDFRLIKKIVVEYVGSR